MERGMSTHAISRGVAILLAVCAVASCTNPVYQALQLRGVQEHPAGLLVYAQGDSAQPVNDGMSDLGVVPLGSETVESYAILNSSVYVPLELSSLSLVGSEAFTVDPALPDSAVVANSVRESARFPITIHIAPTYPALHTATLSFLSNDPVIPAYSHTFVFLTPVEAVRITSRNGESVSPCIVWTGTEWGIVWQDYRDGNYEVYFARVGADGQKTGDDVRVTSAGGDSRSPEMVWTGSAYGIAWIDNRDPQEEVYFARLGSDGAKQGVDVRVTTSGSSSYRYFCTLGWSDSDARYGVAFGGYRDYGTVQGVFFAQIDSSGTKVAIPDPEPDGRDDDDLLISSTSRLDASGVEVLDDKAISGVLELVPTAGGARPSFMSIGNGFSILAPRRIGGQDDFGVFPAVVSMSEDGEPSGTVVPIGDTNYFAGISATISASLALGTGTIGVAWSDDRDGNPEIYFARFAR